MEGGRLNFLSQAEGCLALEVCSNPVYGRLLLRIASPGGGRAKHLLAPTPRENAVKSEID